MGGKCQVGLEGGGGIVRPKGRNVAPKELMRENYEVELRERRLICMTWKSKVTIRTHDLSFTFADR